MKKGMSLIEVLVGSVLLAIVIVAIMNVFAVNHKLMANNKKSFLAEQLLRERNEIIKHEISKKTSYADLNNYISGLEPDTISAGLEDGKLIEFIYNSVFVREAIDDTYLNTPIGIAPFVFNVTTTISWDDGDITVYTMM